MLGFSMLKLRFGRRRGLHGRIVCLQRTVGHRQSVSRLLALSETHVHLLKVWNRKVQKGRSLCSEVVGVAEVVAAVALAAASLAVVDVVVSSAVVDIVVGASFAAPAVEAFEVSLEAYFEIFVGLVAVALGSCSGDIETAEGETSLGLHLGVTGRKLGVAALGIVAEQISAAASVAVLGGIHSVAGAAPVRRVLGFGVEVSVLAAVLVQARQNLEEELVRLYHNYFVKEHLDAVVVAAGRETLLKLRGRLKCFYSRGCTR